MPATVYQREIQYFRYVVHNFTRFLSFYLGMKTSGSALESKLSTICMLHPNLTVKLRRAIFDCVGLQFLQVISIVSKDKISSNTEKSFTQWNNGSQLKVLCVQSICINHFLNIFCCQCVNRL